MAWFTNYAKVKQSGLLVSIKESIVGIDLDGASEADILTYEQNVDALVKEVGLQVGIAKTERDQADAIVALYNQKLDAIGLLQADAEANPADAAAINAVIEEEVAALEAMQADVEREKQEAIDAEAELADLKVMAAEAAKVLKDARTNLNKAKTELQKAERDAEREESKLKRMSELKGLTSNVGKLNTALDIMNKKTAEARAEAEGHKLKGKLLGVGDDKKSDIMQKAMERASGKVPASSSSIADRLAALKK